MESFFLRIGYSESLDDFLLGYNCSTGEFGGSDQYTLLWLGTLVLAFVGALVFYRVWDPVRNKGRKWVLTLGITAFVAFVATYIMITNAEEAGEIGACLLQDDNGNVLITQADFLLLGLSSAVMSALFYIVISVIFRFLGAYGLPTTTNNRHTPL